MGKKSKRVRNSKNNNNNNDTMEDDVDVDVDGNMTPPALRSPHRGGGGGKGGAEVMEETKDNLQFEDPFVDEIIEDEEEDWEDDDDDDDGMNPTSTATSSSSSFSKKKTTNLPSKQDDEEWVQTQTLNPYYATKEPLEMDPSAYKMHFALKGEWPSLSFDFIADVWGEGRTRFPHSLLAVVGTQADSVQKNSLQIWKLSDLGKMDKDDEDDEDVDYDKEDDDKDSDDDDDDIDYDPILEYTSVPHKGGINRVRTHNGIVATWSDVGTIHLYTIDVESICANITTNSDSTKPQLFHSYHGHSTEGYAMNFSNMTHELATGDNDGSIHVHAPDGRSATKLYTSSHSVEDIAWSPTEATVLSAAEAGGLVKIYDTRAPNKAMLTKRAGTGSTDVNALCWSPLVTNLLGTGCDDGMWSVWDLRKLEDPLARFTSHTTPITSMEWHPTDESMLVVSDEVGSFVYDLSVEEEEGNTNSNNTTGANTGDTHDVNKDDLPPQLLFVHSGSPQTKEVHWHPQITSLLMSTAYDGFHTFIPSNL